MQIDSAAFKQAGDSVVRSALFGVAANSFAAAAAGSNCANASYTVGIIGYVATIKPSGIMAPAAWRDRPCNANHFASPQYYAQVWRKAENPGPQEYVNVEINFKAGPGGALICDFIKAFSEFVEATFTPELLPEGQAADNEIGIVFFFDPLR